MVPGPPRILKVRWILPIAISMMVAGVAPTLHAREQQVRVRSDITYRTVGRAELALDLYLPPQRGEHPAVVWIHGGRWSRGDKADGGDVEAAATIAAHGFLVASVNYRLAGKERTDFPAAVEDVEAAVTWLRRHAEQLDVDPRRIALAGNSAGGHLAVLVGTLGQGSLTEGTRVAAVVSFSGPMDLGALQEGADASLKEAVAQFLGCSGGASCARLAVRASPVAHVDPTDPPVFLANSSDEVIPFSQATEMAEALEEARVPHRVVEVPGTHHGLAYMSWVKPLGGTARTLPELYLHFLGRELDVGVVPREPSLGALERTPSGAEKTSGQATGGPSAGDAGGINVALVTIALVALTAPIVLIALRRRRRAAGPSEPPPSR